MTEAAAATPLYNSRILDSYLKLIRKKYAHVDVQELLLYAGVKECEVVDQGHWFTQHQVDRFHEKLVQLSGNAGISREAGRYAASTGSLGFVREFLLGLMGPEYVLLLITRIAAHFSRSSRYTCRRMGRRQLEVTVTFAEGVQERPYQCQNRIGYFETIFLLFNYEYPEIRHTECIFNGGRVCRYLITWQPPRSSSVLWTRRFSLFLLLSSLVMVLRLASNTLHVALFLSAVPISLVISFLAHNAERRSMLSSVAIMRETSDQLLAQVQKNYDSALMLNEIGQVISKKIELEQILKSVNQVLVKRLKYGRGVILLANPEANRLELRSCFGFTPQEEDSLRRTEHPFDAEPPGVLIRCFLRQEPFLVNGLVDVKEFVRPEYLALFESLKVKSFICAPIVCDGETLGVLAVDDANREGDLLQSDLNLIQGIAPVIGGAIRNARHLAKERALADELRAASELMERRVEERTSALSHAHDELESLYDSMSHDLRTPLRIIYGYAELILDGYGDCLDQAAKGYLDCIIKGGEHMELTLDQMLEYSKARVMDLKLAPVDLSALASETLKDLTVTDKRRVLSARIQDGVVVTGDEKLLKSVMENLLGNAWKYCAGKPVTSIEFGMEDGVCFLRDNGAGFDMAEADQLFMPFHRLHHDSDFAGHGLGLATVRRIVQRLGGRVWAEGRPGEGATFYFTVGNVG